ncbi:GntR family transcriptional regulator [Arthrobacter sp. MAHUQ-56]
MNSASDAISSLSPKKPRRATSAEQTADVLREAITTGILVPGMKLQEEALTASLGVARNTLRESFKTLIHEGLLVHEINRGVSVTAVTIEGIKDVYGVRTLLETNAIRSAPADADLSAIRAAVEKGQRLAAEGDWAGVGTANIAFHRAVVELARSQRQNDIMRSLLAETRLHASSWGEPKMWHEPFVPKNRAVYEALEAGDRPKAAALMEENLQEACHYLVTHHENAAKDLAS